MNDPTGQITAALTGDNSPLNHYEADWVAEALTPLIERLQREAAAAALQTAADDWELRGLTLTANELRTCAERALRARP